MEGALRSGTLRALIADDGGPLFVACQVVREINGVDPYNHFGSKLAAQLVQRVKPVFSSSSTSSYGPGVVRPIRG
jgi:hypothetical protein